MKAAGIGSTGVLTGLAGCSGSESPPPRKSNVFEPITVNNNALLIPLVPDSKRWVYSRRDVEASDRSAIQASLAALAPVGVAQAAKGSGATGRGSGGFRSAPKSRKGRAVFYGDDDDDEWYDDHDDEVYRYPAQITQLGVAYLGTNAVFTEQAPGPGPVDWDETYQDPSESVTADIANAQPGWYRVGTRVAAERAGNETGEVLGWESVDTRVEERNGTKVITERWKVSPRV
jgi:hypothetical protein